MSTAHAIDNDRMVIVGMVLSNGLVGLAGSVFAQSQGVADVLSASARSSSVWRP